MKAATYTEFDPADSLRHQERQPSVSKVNAPTQSLADRLIQFTVRRPRAFLFAYGSGPALLALWLFIGSVQKSEWLWAIVSGSWLAGIVTCVGGIHYLLSMSAPVSHHPDS